MVDVPKTADIVIVGGGVHGASLAYHFARKKAGRIVLIEKKFIASGPTGRSTALVRRVYPMGFFTRTAGGGPARFPPRKDRVGRPRRPGVHPVGVHVAPRPRHPPLVPRQPPPRP